MGEGVEKGDDVRTPWVVGIGRGDLGEELDLVSGSFGISTSGFDDFESGMCLLAAI